jgi:hypothetical protein
LAKHRMMSASTPGLRGPLYCLSAKSIEYKGGSAVNTCLGALQLQGETS